MNKIFPLFLLLLIGCKCFGQKEANIWYFGQQAGVDFNSGVPVAITNCSNSFNAFEGVGTLSDANGNLLFYTDGNNVFNANHVTMPNGTGLFSNTSSTQTGLSIKQPGSDSIYYVFHIDISFGGTLYYSIVDMSLNGGLGNVIQKNILLRNNTTEKVTGVFHSNGTDIWILTHDFSSNAFVAYLFSASGLSATPVVSNTGQVYTDAIGYLKASPQGTMLASADFGMGTYSLYDFDNTTGVVSNANTSPANYMYAYGCEWSPGGTKLYGGQENSNDLWQFDVSAGANVWNTATLIYETLSQEYEALQLGPDGKIYTSRYQTAWLGVVNDPDSAGLDCNYVDNGVNLQGRVCYLGLPNYNMSIFNSQIPSAAFASSDTSVCEKFCINFYDSSLTNPSAWQWIFAGASPSTSTLQNPTNICYTTPGIYDVTLIITNASGNDTLTLSNYITVHATPPFPTITQIDYLLMSSAASSYQWQLNSADIAGATNQSYNVLQTGLYTVVVGDSNGCANSTSKYVLISGIDDLNDTGISIYPNPSAGSFTVEWSGGQMAGKVSISVTNTLGQIIFSSEEQNWTPDSKKEIDVCRDAKSCASTGIYFIEIKTENISLKKKIMIAK